MALALLMQTAPCPNVIDNLPDLPSQAAIMLSADVPLLEILDPADSAGLNAPSAAGADTTPTIYSHVNRVLDRISVAAGVKAALTSHPFPRGGAQHANGSGELTARWIFDRGAWNMSTANKGFNYIFNTSKEDHKVSKILSGYGADAKVPLQDLTSFDSQTKATITKFQRLLFTTCHGLETTRHNVNQAVLDVLTASDLRHYPLLKSLNAEIPAIKRIEACTVDCGSSSAELLASSSHLLSPESTCEDSKPSSTQQQQEAAKQPTGPSNEKKIIVHQAAVINHFIEHTKRQDARMDALEAKPNYDPIQASNMRHKPETDTSDVSKIKKEQRRSAVTHLRATWYAWYAQEPRLCRAPISKQQKSDAKQLVAFMKLFLEDGFVLDAATPDYRDQVLALGSRAEKSVLAFLGERSISSRDSCRPQAPACPSSLWCTQYHD